MRKRRKMGQIGDCRVRNRKGKVGREEA